MNRRFLSIAFISLLYLIASSTCSFSKPEDEITISVDNEGGTYDLFHGVAINIPPGATETDVEITLRKVQEEEFESIMSEENKFLIVIETLPDGQTFDAPLRLTIEGLELEPGVPPIVRLLDLEKGTLKMVETNASYDPESGTLEFSIEHFSTYGVEAGRQFASRECQETPCRCGSIKIKQTDADAMCSVDDCKILESEVSVQFNDCQGKPVETSYLKEVSSTCQPRLILEPAQSKVQLGGSTSVTATTLISCIPISEQTVDFISNDLGQLDPTFQMTDAEGKAATTFIAGQEEGIANVMANVTGSYYAYEVRANGESFNGPMKTYELSKTVEIEIGEMRGLFEGSFTGCNELVCLDDYQISMDFTVTELLWENELWVGDAVVIQTGSITSNIDTHAVSNLRMPGQLEFTLGGPAIQEAGELELFIRSYLEDQPLILWDMVQIDEPGCQECITQDLFSVGVFPFLLPDGTHANFVFNLDGSDTPQTGDAFFALIGRPPDIKGTYTLTWE